MHYEIISEPKYRNKVLVILEGQDKDGSYFTMETVFTKGVFDNKASKDLLKLLGEYYNSENIFLHELSNDSFELEFSDLSDCEDMTGHEVLYFDENGVCYPVLMIFKK